MFTAGWFFPDKTRPVPKRRRFVMKKFAALTMALGLISGVALAQETLTEHQVRTRLDEQGYTKVNELKSGDGVWKADARSADGNRLEVRIDPKTGKVYPDE